MTRATICAAFIVAGALAYASAQELPSGAGADTFRARCLTCHGPELVAQQRLSREGWSREIDKMVGWGAIVEAADREGLLDYLAANFGLAVRSPRQDRPADAAAALLKTRCMGCHDLRLIDQQRLNVDGWAREIDKMIGWGALVTSSEKDALVDHLARTRGVVLSYRP